MVGGCIVGDITILLPPPLIFIVAIVIQLSSELGHLTLPFWKRSCQGFYLKRHFFFLFYHPCIAFSDLSGTSIILQVFAKVLDSTTRRVGSAQIVLQAFSIARSLPSTCVHYFTSLVPFSLSNHTSNLASVHFSRKRLVKGIASCLGTY